MKKINTRSKIAEVNEVLVQLGLEVEGTRIEKIKVIKNHLEKKIEEVPEISEQTFATVSVSEKKDIREQELRNEAWVKKILTSEISKSDKIRRFLVHEIERLQIARLVECRYQMVRNIEVKMLES